MSTSGPADGSETAHVIDDMVRKCPHDHADPSRDRLKEAQDLAASASDCLQAAQSLHEARQHRDLVEDYLRQALENADAADQLMEQAEREESSAIQANAAAMDAAADAGVSISTGAKHLAIVADTRATTAERFLAEESDREARILRARCSEIRQQAQLLLDQL